MSSGIQVKRSRAAAKTPSSSVAAKRGRGRPKNPLAKERVTHVAAGLFAQKGYVETTMQDIAAGLGVTKPTLYAYAESKSDILRDIVLHWMQNADDVLEIVASENDPVRQIELLIRGWTKIAIENAEVYKVYLAEEEDLAPQFVRRYRKWSDTAYKRIQHTIGAGQSAGIFSRELDTRVATFALISFFHLLPRWYDENKELTQDDVANHFQAIVLRGLGYRS